MTILSRNVSGIHAYKKRLKIKKFLLKHCPDIVLLQETKLQQLDEKIIKSIWSSNDVGWLIFDSIGRSGGIQFSNYGMKAKCKCKKSFNDYFP